MTIKLYDEDSYIKEFEATVLDSYPKADGFFTILDRTAFFPEGGGQPSDIGFLNDSKVYDVQINDGIIYHYTTKHFEKGERVTGVIDFSRRFDFMQQHSGEHVVSGIAHSLYGCENVGFHLGSDIVTLDFDKYLTREQVLRIEEEANKKVFANLEVRTYYPDDNILKSLNYRSKKELSEAIRIVEIEETDMCACCAPHIKKTGEIGIIALSGGERLRGGIRLELKCGMRAIKDYNEKKESVSAISSMLCIKQNEVALGVDKLLKQISDLKYQLKGITQKTIENKIQNFTPKNRITAEFEENMEIKDLQYFADALFKKAGGIRVVFSSAENGFSFAVCGEADELSDWFKAFKESFEIRGGGRGNMYQGTVFAKQNDLIKYINKE